MSFAFLEIKCRGAIKAGQRAVKRGHCAIKPGQRSNQALMRVPEGVAAFFLRCGSPHAGNGVATEEKCCGWSEPQRAAHQASKPTAGCPALPHAFVLL